MFVIDPREDLETGTRTIPFAMICHPKTGSQSMQKGLREKFGARPVKGLHHFDQEECERILNNGGIVASTVRNPWDLMVSWYCYSMQLASNNAQYPKKEEFKPWLIRTMMAGNGWIEHGLFPGAQYCNRIFRFEHNLEYQLNQCLKDCGLEPLEFPHIGGTDHGHYSEYYNEETAVAVALRFHSEIVEWGYTFEFGSSDE